MHSLLLRRAGGLALLAALAFSAGAHAQVANRADRVESHIGVHILKAGPNGAIICDDATEAEAEALNRTALNRGGAPLHLTAIPPSKPAGTAGFRIILRATDQLIARPEALLAFRRAAARWERILQNNVTTVIDVDYGPNRFNGGPFAPNILGSTSSAIEFATDSTSAANPGAGPAEMIAALKARHTGDAQLTALYDAIPVPTPSTAPTGNGGRNFGRAIAGLISLQALGFRDAVIDPDDPARQFGSVPAIGFNSAFAYDFDPANGVTAGQTDFEGVAIHEIGHALGFTSNIGGLVTDPNKRIQFTPWDLFRVRPSAVTVGAPGTIGTGFDTALRVITPGPANTDVLVVEGNTTYFKAVQTTFLGDVAYETSTATGSRTGGDGQQASHWRDDALRPPSLGDDRLIGIMDPNIGTGYVDEIKTADIQLLETIGYTVVYTPLTATLALSVNSTAITQPLVVPEQSLGDVAIGGTSTATVTIGNAGTAAAGTDNPLNYDVTVVVDSSVPAGTTPTVTLSSPVGTVAPGAQADLTLSFGGIGEAAFVSGRLQVRTNDDDRAFIEVPFTFSVGGATEPKLVVTSTVPANGDLGDVALDATKTFTVNVGNTGSLPLKYKIFATATTQNLPISTTPTGAGRLARLYGSDTTPIFSANFETPADLSQFTFDATAAPDRWQRTTAGKAALGGHSAPGAAYYGNATAVGTYGSNSVGQLTTPSFDLSALSGDNLVSISFNYYLSAEAGYDFASVVYSIDGGESFEELLTSNGGPLRNTAAGWENVVAEIPGLAGFPDVTFGFRFESDTNTEQEGFYIDDVAIVAVAGQSGFFAAPVQGTVQGNTTAPVTVTLNGPALERGFYEGFVDVVTNQRGNDPAPIDVTFSVGDPGYPSIASVDPAPSFSVAPDASTPVTLNVRNPGDAPLSYVRVLEPALSDYVQVFLTRSGSDAIEATAPSANLAVSAEAPQTTDAEAGTLADGDILSQIDLPATAQLPGDLTQLPDGRLLVLDIGLSAGGYGQAFLLNEDLSGTPILIPSVFSAQQSGIAYDTRTNTIWIAQLGTGAVREFTLGGTPTAPTFVATGRSFLAGVAIVGMAYSPEIDALFLTGFGSNGLYAFDITGKLLPGYPVGVAGRGNQLPGLSFTDGLVEIGTGNLGIGQVGQFGRTFPEAMATTETAVRLGGSPRINGFLRSRTDRDGSAYYVANPSSGVARVFRVDPPNVPARIAGSRVDAGAPLYGNQTVDAQAAFSLPLIIDSKGLGEGSFLDEVAFLTNDQQTPLVRIPVTITVSITGTEASAPGAFAFRGTVPNPVRSAGQVQFSLPEAADVTVSVYNTLGQRVALLVDGRSMAAGQQTVPFSTSGLAAGVYVVRLQAGANVGTQKVTVVR